jgi:hypothetical protein
MIVLELAVWERSDEVRDAYDALAEDIAELGFEVEMPEPIERRGGGAWNVFEPALADLVVYLKNAVDDTLIDLLVAAIVKRVGTAVRSKWPRKREVAILAADGVTATRCPKTPSSSSASARPFQPRHL